MTDQSGLIGGFTSQLDQLWVPEEVWLTEERLCWKAPPSGGWKSVDPKGALDAFMRIKDKEGVLKFARRFGVLSLCYHELPSTHSGRRLIPSGKDHGPGLGACDPLGEAGEPVEIWLQYASKARALVGLSGSLLTNQPCRYDDWRDLFSPKPLLDGGPGAEDLGWAIPYLNRDRKLRGYHVALNITYWTQLGGVVPAVTWSDETEYSTKFFLWSSTFGALGIQMMLAFTRARSLATCDGCGKPYSRKGRLPQRGKRNFCEDCKAVGPRLRKRDHRARNLIGGENVPQG